MDRLQALALVTLLWSYCGNLPVSWWVVEDPAGNLSVTHGETLELTPTLPGQYIITSYHTDYEHSQYVMSERTYQSQECEEPCLVFYGWE